MKTADLESEYLWYTGEGKDPELFNHGFATREEALRDGRGRYGTLGVEVDAVLFTIAQARPAVVPVPSGDDLLAFIEEQASGNADFSDGESDYPDLQDESQAQAISDDLERVVTEWRDRWLHVLPRGQTLEDVRSVELLNVLRASAT